MYATAWISALLFFASQLSSARIPITSASWRLYLSRLGAGVMWLHIGCAYWLTHAGSHRAAVEHVANRTEEFLGLRSGLGIYANFLAALAWSWLALSSSRMTLAKRVAIVFLWCMWISATIIFAQPVSRLFFAALVVAILAANRTGAMLAAPSNKPP